MGALVASVLAAGAASASADEKLLLHRGKVGIDLDFIDQFLQVLEPDFYKPKTDLGGLREMTLDDIYVGRYDVNGDQVEELFVFVYYSTWCGKTGCNLHVFAKEGGDWVEAISARPSPWIGEYEGERVYSLNVWTDPETGLKTVWTSSSVFRWTGERYENIYDARILELEAESFDFAGMDASGNGQSNSSEFDFDKVRHETDWNRGALRHLAPLVDTYRYGAAINDPAIWLALGEIMDRRELAYVILLMARREPIRYDRGYLVLEGLRIETILNDWGNETVRTAMIVVDTRDGSVHAGTRHDRERSIYSHAQNYASLPPLLYDWLHYGERSEFLFGGYPPFNVTWAKPPAQRD